MVGKSVRARRESGKALAKFRARNKFQSAHLDYFSREGKSRYITASVSRGNEVFFGDGWSVREAIASANSTFRAFNPFAK